MRRAAISLSALALLAAPVGAQPDSPEKPITKRSPDAVDVATTPISDLNIRKDEIPQLLIEAQEKPYDLGNLGRCNQLAAKIGEFDALLGDDIDLPQTPGARVSAGRMAQSVVGSLMPFRGIVREISGANDQRRKVQAAIEAGYARRSFLKGVGQERGCRYPARSATREVWDRRVAEIEAAKAAKDKDKDKKEPATREVAGNAGQ